MLGPLFIVDDGVNAGVGRESEPQEAAGQLTVAESDGPAWAGRDTDGACPGGTRATETLGTGQFALADLPSLQESWWDDTRIQRTGRNPRAILGG